MTHAKMFPYLVGAAALVAVLIAFGVPLGSLLPFAFILVCPLMMFVMMRGMGSMHGGEDHTGSWLRARPDPQGRRAHHRSALTVLADPR